MGRDAKIVQGMRSSIERIEACQIQMLATIRRIKAKMRTGAARSVKWT